MDTTHIPLQAQNLLARKRLPRVGDTGPEAPAELSGKMQIVSIGAAESAALDREFAIVSGAWLLLTPHCRSIIVGMCRKALRFVE
jgi:hypothetical protein